MFGLIAPTAYRSPCRGSKNQPAGVRPVTSARISVVRAMLPRLITLKPADILVPEAVCGDLMTLGG